MELGIISDEISLDLEEALREGRQLGFRKYEIRCLDDYEHRVPYFKPGRMDQLKAAIADGRMDVTAVTPGLFKGALEDEETVMRELETVLPDTCKVTRELGADMIIVFAFKDTGPDGRTVAMDHLRRAAAITREHGIRLAIENEPGMYCDTGVKTAAFLKELDEPNVGVNWDPGNACSAGEAAFPVGYEAIKPWLINLHIKDTIPIPPDKWENRLVGDGGINWIGQLHALKRDAILPHLTLETHVFPVLEATREDVRRLRLLFEWIDAFFPHA